MKDDILEFNTLKNTILCIIKKSNQIVSLTNSVHESGIYLLYVNNFDDNKILPFYIGQAIDFSKRFKTHIKDINKLIKHGYTEYHNNLFFGAVGDKSPFEGNFRPCKILKYIIDHDCSIDDVKMIILEKCDKEELDKKEQYYLSLYLPSFFGFNQIPTITEQFYYKNNTEKMCSLIQEDSDCFCKYMKYGYSTFNYLHAFTGYGNQELDKKVNLLTSNHLWSSKQDLLTASCSAINNYHEIYKKTYRLIHDKFAKQIHNIFSKHQLKSKSREADVLAAFTNHFQTNIVFDINHNLQYLEYYFSRDKRSRECGIELNKFYNRHAEELDRLTTPVKNALSYI